MNTFIIKTAFLALFIGVIASCGGKKGSENTTTTHTDSTGTVAHTDHTTSTATNSNTTAPTKTLEKGKFPFEFPVVETLNGAAGDNVFAVNMKLVMNDFNAGKTSFGTQYLLAKLAEPGAKESKVNFVSDDMVPNSGIVVIPKGQTAKVGDIVAGKWAVNLTRAIVTDASNPKAPKATFIGLTWDNPAKAEDKKTGIGQFEYTLKENEFMVISNAFDPGSCCAVKKDGKYKLMDIFRAEGDMVMGTIFTEFTAVPKSDCIAIPLKGNFKVGDDVWAPWVGTMAKGKVTKVDAKMGRYTIKFAESYQGEKVISFGEVIKDLPM